MWQLDNSRRKACERGWWWRWEHEKNRNIKVKMTCRWLKSIFTEHEAKSTMFSLKEDFVIVPIDKAANNVAFIYKDLVP